MSTEFNYVARLDTSQIMSGLSEIRSQVGMALGGGGGFGGGPFSATNFGGPASSAVEEMIRSMPYGMQGAATSLPQEMAIFGAGGMAAAGRMAPPGVSAGEFAFAALSNNIERSIQAREAARMAGEAAFATNAGGLLAGDIAMGLATPLGALAGGKVASSLFGAGAARAGAAIGGLAAGVGAMFLVSGHVGDKIGQHYAEVQQGIGITRELGEIVGSGRGLSRSQVAELGISAYDAARGIKMDFNQFGDIMALARENGMLPSTSDPQNFKQEAMNLANAVREVSQTLHSSFSEAAQLIKSAAQKGIGIEEAMIRSVNVGQGPDYSGIMRSVGVITARAGGFTGAHGGQLFADAYGQAGGTGISSEEMAILGGRTQVASLIGSTQLAAAASPLGTMQLMAARGGAPLGGMMDLPGQALAAMGEGGDMIGNLIRFQVHGDEYRRGLGAKGIRTMALNQLGGMADMIENLSGGSLSGEDAKKYAAMQMYNMTGTQAEAYVGGLSRAPGGGGPSKITRATQIATLAYEAQDERIAAAMSRLPAPEQRASFGLGYAIEGAVAGSIFGPGALAGGAAGLVVGNAKALWQSGGDLFEDLGHVFDSADEKRVRAIRREAAAYDQSMAGIRNQAGFLGGDAVMAGRLAGSDISGLQLTMTSSGPRAMAMTEAAFRLSGMTPVAAGPGTIQMGGVSWSSAQGQQVILGGIGGKPLSSAERERIEQAAYSAFYDPSSKSADVKKQIIEDLKTLGKEGADPLSDEYRTAANRVFGDVMTMTEMVSDPKVRAALQKDIKKRGFVGKDTQGRAFLESGGIPVDLLSSPAMQAASALGSAGADYLASQRNKEMHFLADAFGGGGDEADQLVMAKAMMGNKRYQRAKEMIKRGASPEKINAELQAAYRSAVVQRGGVPDSTKVEQGVGAPADVGNGAFDVSRMDYRTKFQSEDDKKGQAVSLEMMVLGEATKGREALFRKSGEKGMGGEVREKAIGFGEQEQAMSEINRSLQRTHSMLEALEKKISGKGGSPSVPTGKASTKAPRKGEP